VDKYCRLNITLPQNIAEELERVATELQDKRSRVIVKALELYFAEIDVIIAEKRLQELQNGKTELVSTEEVWAELGL